MATLRYWDKYSSSWRIVGGKSIPPNLFVPLSGGTITGDLVVDSGDPWEMQVGTKGTLKTGSIQIPPDGNFDGNIRLSTVRTVDFGGARVQRVSEPLYDDSAVTKRYIDTALVRTTEAMVPTLGEGWRTLRGDYGLPRYRLGASGRCVILEGILVADEVFLAPVPNFPMFVLPDGYRPSGRAIFMVVGGDDLLSPAGNDFLFSVAVNATGEVWLHSGPVLDSKKYISLDGCRFPLPPVARDQPVGG